MTPTTAAAVAARLGRGPRETGSPLSPISERFEPGTPYLQHVMDAGVLAVLSHDRAT